MRVGLGFVVPVGDEDVTPTCHMLSLVSALDSLITGNEQPEVEEEREGQV